MHEDDLEQLARRVPGAGIVAAYGGSIRAFGAVEPGDRFEIGSVTKLFTGRLLAILAQEGLVRLDEPARDCLGSDWPLPERITLERLARHRTGLPRTPRKAWRTFREHPDDPWRGVDLEDLRASLPPLIPRGRWFRYSNFGAALLGHALAARAGMPWERLIEDKITGPAGLAATGVDEPVVQPHGRRGKPVPPWSLAQSAVAPAGALRSTAADLLRFLPAADSPSWMDARGVLWHNGGTGGSSAFVSRDPPVVLLANAAIAQRLTALGLTIARS